MKAQEWLDELEQLREAATPGPWKHNIEPRRDGMGFIWPFSSIESEDANVTDSITRADAAYIVAACNAVPMLVEMLRIAVSLIEAQNAQRARKGEKMPEGDVMQLLFTMTEPKE